MLHTPLDVAFGVGVLGIQGDSGVGKSTIANAVASYYGVTVYETSNAFRGLTAFLLYHGVNIHDEEAVSTSAELWFPSYQDVEGHVIIGGLDVTSELRSDETTSAVAVVAGYIIVRRLYQSVMINWVHDRPAIVVGRHLHEVWPKAYIVQIERQDSATHDARERDEGESARASLHTRNQKDRENEAVALKGRSQKVTIVDTTGLTEDQQRDLVIVHAFRAGFRFPAAVLSETS